MYSYLRNLYISGRLTKSGLNNAVKLGWITKAQSDQIIKEKGNVVR